MSGSFDDETTGRRPAPTLTHDPLRGPSAGGFDGRTRAPTLQPTPAGAFAPPPAMEPGREQANAPIVQAGSVTGRSLTLVIAIMCFLACLTAGAVYLINKSASAWERNIGTEVTIQVEPSDSEKDTEDMVQRIRDTVAGHPGILDARAVSKAETAALLEPWLGQNAELANLPVPRMIAVELDRNAPPDFSALREALNKSYPKATFDDHRHWNNQIRTVTRSFNLGGIAILLLVGAATTAIIVSATRSAMASNREIVEVLHFVGATDRFIAREFAKHFLTLGIRAGIVGAASAMAVFFLMPSVMQLLGGGTVTLAELKRLVGTGALDIWGYILLSLVVVIIAALCMFTSRFGVFRILHSQN
jgi:cell division transport system permease protein